MGHRVVVDLGRAMSTSTRRGLRLAFALVLVLDVSRMPGRVRLAPARAQRAAIARHEGDQTPLRAGAPRCAGRRWREIAPRHAMTQLAAGRRRGARRGGRIDARWPRTLGAGDLPARRVHYNVGALFYARATRTRDAASPWRCSIVALDRGAAGDGHLLFEAGRFADATRLRARSRSTASRSRRWSISG